MHPDAPPAQAPSKAWPSLCVTVERDADPEVTRPPPPSPGDSGGEEERGVG